MSIETKHTPGPWITDDFDDCDKYRYVMGVNGNGPVYIARLSLTNKFGIHSDAYRCQEANARLIAAAPELLEALQEAELVLAEKLRRLGADPNVSPTTHRIRAAITKATGSEV